MGSHPATRSGKAAGSPFIPTGSPEINIEKGVPVEAVKIPASSQPPSRDPTGPPILGVGASQMKFTTKFFPILKSHRPRRLASSNQSSEEGEFPNWSPNVPPEPSSMHLPQV